MLSILNLALNLH